MDERQPEIARVVEVDRRLADRVRSAVAGRAFPLVLAGNCNSCLGTVAGLPNEELGVVWFDAHADFDTPDDNVSGFFDVMGLAILTGSAWPALSRTVDGFATGEGRANEYAAPDGPGLAKLLTAIDRVFQRFHVDAAA